MKHKIKINKFQKKTNQFFLNPDLIKCVECDKEIKLGEKSSRYQNFWYHESCYKPISKNKYEQEKIKLEKPITKKPILEPHRQSPKIKHDPVLILLTILIFIFLFSAAYL